MSVPICCLLAFLPICSVSAELQVKSESGENLKASAGETETGSQSPWDDWPREGQSGAVGAAVSREEEPAPVRGSIFPRPAGGVLTALGHREEAGSSRHSASLGVSRGARGPRWWWDRPRAAGDIRRHWVLAVLPAPKLCPPPGGPGNGELPTGTVPQSTGLQGTGAVMEGAAGGLGRWLADFWGMRGTFP